MEHETRRSHKEIKKPFWKSWRFWTVFIVIVLLVAGISSCVNAVSYTHLTLPTKLEV